MSSTRSFALDDHLAAFLEAEVAEGRYATESEVIAAGLRLLEERARRLTILREALAEGDASGDPAPFDIDVFIAGQLDEDRSGK